MRFPFWAAALSWPRGRGLASVAGRGPVGRSAPRRPAHHVVRFQRRGGWRWILVAAETAVTIANATARALTYNGLLARSACLEAEHPATPCGSGCTTA